MLQTSVMILQNSGVCFSLFTAFNSDTVYEIWVWIMNYPVSIKYILIRVKTIDINSVGFVSRKAGMIMVNLTLVSSPLGESQLFLSQNWFGMIHLKLWRLFRHRCILSISNVCFRLLKNLTADDGRIEFCPDPVKKTCVFVSFLHYFKKIVCIIQMILYKII